jgi:hypothetical protein
MKPEPQGFFLRLTIGPLPGIDTTHTFHFQ